MKRKEKIHKNFKLNFSLKGKLRLINIGKFKAEIWFIILGLNATWLTLSEGLI